MSFWDAFIVRGITLGSPASILLANTGVVLLAFLLIHVVFRRFLAFRRIQEQSPARSDFAREAFFGALTLIIGALAAMLTIHLAERGAIKVTTGKAGAATLALQTLGFFVGLDLYLYVVHRFLHLRPVYRWVHYLHHRSVTPNPLTAFSSHPLEAILNSAYIPLSLALFTVDQQAILVVSAYTQIHTVFLHCGREPFPRWWLEGRWTRWLATPLFHDLHHSRVSTNYGFYTTVWDRLFASVGPAYRQAIESFGFGRAMVPH